MHNQFLRGIFLVILLTGAIFSQALAEANFDFGLPLFGFEEIRFEKSKPADFNIHLLKKYLIENEGEMLQQLHGINRWFSLLLLSDTPRRDELIAQSSSFFSNADKKKVSNEEKLREVFFFGLLLSQDKSPDPGNKQDQAFEDLLIDAEEQLAEVGDYWLVKGIVFHLLRDRPNGYFQPMKPEEDLKRALGLIQKTAHYYYVMGQAFRFLGSNDSSLFLSIASYERASSLDPRNHKLQNALLGIYMGLHESYQTAGKQEPFWLEEAVYKKILAISPHNPHALNNLGFLYAEYGVNTKQAQELCQRAVDITPENPGFRDSLGWAAFKNRDYVKAEEELKKSLSIKKNVYDPHYHLGTVYYATGQLEKAAEYYEQAIAIKPDAVEALNNLAYLYTEQGRKLPEAMAMAKTAVRLEPGNASYIDTLGWTHYRMGELDTALTMLLKAAQIAPGQGEILLHIGRVYLDLNDFDQALTYLKEAHKADPALNDPDNSLYVAIRLKSYHRALADYHGMFGENADRNKVNNILMSIARMYQEEKLYDKAVDITKLCAEIKSGAKSLKEPLFSSYQLSDTDKPKIVVENEDEVKELIPPVEGNVADEIPAEEETGAATGEIIDEMADEATVESDIENASSITDQPAETTVETATEAVSKIAEPAAPPAETTQKSLFSGLPPVTGHPITFAMGPRFFEQMQAILPGMQAFSGKSVTVFIEKFRRPGRTAVIRIDSKDTAGKAMMSLALDFVSQMNGKIEPTDRENAKKVTFGTKRQLFLHAEDNSLYISSRPFKDKTDIALLKTVLKYDSTNFAAIIYDWQALSQMVPSFVRPFIANPFRPFNRIYTRYTYENGDLNEFSAVTTGKEENEAFMRRLARELFEFKIFTNQIGIESTIKVRQEKDIIYISNDFEQVNAFIEKRLQRINSLLVRFIMRYLNHTRCFLNR
ncbi:MAG: hypothetical protein ACD_39C01655G0003, partial [uncultured bacterium]